MTQTHSDTDSPGNTPPPVATEKPRIVVIDDDPMLRLLARRSLESAGMVVEGAENGRIGLELIGRAQPDLIIVDVFMPIMDGYDVCRAVRADAASRDTPILMITGLDDLECIERAYEAGATDFLVKPLHWSVLPHHVHFVLRAANAMKRLIDSEERYALASRGANDGLWDWDLTTASIYYSPRWESMFGYPEGSLSNNLREWFQRVHPEDLARLSHDLDTHLAAQTEYLENEHRVRSADGNYQWVLCRGLAIRDTEDRATRIAGSLTDISRRKKVEAQLQHDASHDALTGLPNRLLFMDRLGHAIKLAQRREDYMFAVMFVDLDRFKIINDSLGHQYGDDLLMEVSRRIQACIRENDTLARLGGDEFTLLIDDLTDPDFVTQIAERIQSAVSEPLLLNKQQIRTSASIGINYASPRYKHAEDMLRDADTAMYRAKRLGKARHVIFDETMHTQAMDDLGMEMEMRAALAESQFCLLYQPIFSLHGQKLAGFEALLRWQHPTRGDLSPETFLGIAEESGLIVPIGRWALEESCRQLQSWSEHISGAGDWFVSVNVSAKEFGQPDFVNFVGGVLGHTGLSPSRLKLEFQEKALIGTHSAVRAKLADLNAQNVQIAVDDFGASYSAMGYLNDLPVKLLKVDRALIQTMEKTDQNLAVIKAILGLAHSLKIPVVAKGSETHWEIETLKALNCEFTQGKFFHEPMRAEEISSWTDADALNAPSLEPGGGTQH